MKDYLIFTSEWVLRMVWILRWVGFAGFLVGFFNVLSLDPAHSQVEPPVQPGQLSTGLRLTDPYAILGSHYEAVGGLERLKNEKTSYSRGTIAFAKMKGIVEVWSEDVKYRRKAQYPAFTLVEGDNGQYAWSVDLNDKQIIHKDPETLKRRKISELLEDFENFNRNSPYFSLRVLGIETVQGTPCYVLETRNSINRDVYIDYFDTESFLLLKQIVKEPYLEIATVFSDFRKQDGMTYAFRSQAEISPTGKKIDVQTEELLINIPIDRNLYELPKQEIRDFTFDKGTSSEGVPVIFRNNHLILPVTLKGETRYWVLDSGADMSVIDQEVAIELDLKPQGVLLGNATSHLAEFSFLQVEAYQVQGIKFYDQTMLAYEGLASKFNDPPIIGILGYDFLSRFVTKIDFSTHHVSFYDPATFNYQGGGNKVEAPLQDRLFVFPMIINGTIQGRFGLDLGAFDVTMNYRFAHQNNFLTVPGVTRLSSDLSGVYAKRQIKTQSLDVGGYVVTNELISFPMDEGLGANSSGELDGFIGIGLLRHFTVYLDYKNQQLIFEKGKEFGKAFPVDRSGMTIGPSRDNLPEIFLVADNTPASQAGLLIGDIILGIQEKQGFRPRTVKQLQSQFQAEAGTHYVLKVLRENQEIFVMIELRDLHESPTVP